MLTIVTSLFFLSGLTLGSEPIATDNFNAAIKVSFFCVVVLPHWAWLRVYLQRERVIYFLVCRGNLFLFRLYRCGWFSVNRRYLVLLAKKGTVDFVVLELRVCPGANQSQMTEWTTWRGALRSWSLIVLYNEDCVIATSPSQRCRDTPVKGLNEISRELLYFFVSIRGNTMADSTRRQRSLVLSKRGIQCRLIRRASCRRDSLVYRS